VVLLQCSIYRKDRSLSRPHYCQSIVATETGGRTGSHCVDLDSGRRTKENETYRISYCAAHYLGGQRGMEVSRSRVPDTRFPIALSCQLSSQVMSCLSCASSREIRQKLGRRSLPARTRQTGDGNTWNAPALSLPRKI
jgi:hypothetical protein